MSYTPQKGMCGSSSEVDPQEVKSRLRWMGLYHSLDRTTPESGVVTRGVGGLWSAFRPGDFEDCLTEVQLQGF